MQVLVNYKNIGQMTQCLPSGFWKSLRKDGSPGFAVASACLAVGLSVAVPGSRATAGDSLTEFQAVGMRYVGTWVGSGTYSTDFPGVAKKGDQFSSTSTCSWTAARSAILCQGVEGIERKENGVQLIYWDPAKKKLRMTLVDSGGNFDQGIGSVQADKVVWKSVGKFADGRQVRFEWTTTFTNNDNTQSHSGFVTVDGVKSNFSYAVKRVIK